MFIKSIISAASVIGVIFTLPVVAADLSIEEVIVTGMKRDVM